MEAQRKYDYLEPIEVSRGVYWVGFYDEVASFHCNPYLFIDGEEAIILDPGSLPHYPTVASKVLSLVEPEQISYIIAHHQDPDLCASIPLFEEIILKDSLKIVTHSRASLLINYYGVKSAFYNIDNNGNELRLKSGRTLKFINTPFCHFPGAFATYDEKNKLLFTSDIFAATSIDWNLFAREGYEEEMDAFHTNYMPSRKHLNFVMDKFERLDIKMILPQHGSIIQGNMIPKCVSHLRQLECGLDLLDKEE